MPELSSIIFFKEREKKEVIKRAHTHTHTHTHTHSLFLSLSLSHTHTHTHIGACTLASDGDERTGGNDEKVMWEENPAPGVIYDIIHN